MSTANNDFLDFMAAIAAEAVAEGPAAVAELKKFDAEFYLAAQLTGQAEARPQTES